MDQLWARGEGAFAAMQRDPVWERGEGAFAPCSATQDDLC
jgi:hypothetical protein